MDQIMSFAFGDNLVRTIMDDSGEPWFVAKDVALALGYQWAGIRNVQHVPEEWRRVESVSTLRRGEQEMHLLSEQGLNFFVLRSDKPAALPFQKWLAGEVLPALRRTGRYAMEDATPEAMLDDLMPNLTNKERLMCLRMATQLLLSGKSVAELRSVFLQLCCLLRPAPQQVDLSDTDDLGALLRTFIDQCVEQERGRRLKSREFYEAFSHWCANNGHTGTYSIKAVSVAVQRLGLLRVRQVRPCIVYGDVRLRPGV